MALIGATYGGHLNIVVDLCINGADVTPSGQPLNMVRYALGFITFYSGINYRSYSLSRLLAHALAKSFLSSFLFFFLSLLTFFSLFPPLHAYRFHHYFRKQTNENL